MVFGSHLPPHGHRLLENRSSILRVKMSVHMTPTMLKREVRHFRQEIVEALRAILQIERVSGFCQESLNVGALWL